MYFPRLSTEQMSIKISICLSCPCLPTILFFYEKGRQKDHGSPYGSVNRAHAKTIEKKDEQVRELREMIENLRTTVANLTETFEEIRRKFSALPVKNFAGKM